MGVGSLQDDCTGIAGAADDGMQMAQRPIGFDFWPKV